MEILRSSFSTAQYAKKAAEFATQRKLPQLSLEHAITSLPLNNQLFDFVETRPNLFRTTAFPYTK